MIDGVHIWRATLDGPGWPAAAELPPDERERAAAFLREEVAQRWVASRWALRRVLGDYLGVAPTAVELELGDHGKPQLAGEARLEFNLSHSEGLALIAVATRTVGIDLEAIRPGRDLRALADRTLPAEDVAAFASAAADQQADVFYRAWTRHEARIKCLGTELGEPLNAAKVAVEDLYVPPGYAAAVAVVGAEVGTLTRSEASP